MQTPFTRERLAAMSPRERAGLMIDTAILAVAATVAVGAGAELASRVDPEEACVATKTGAAAVAHQVTGEWPSWTPPGLRPFGELDGSTAYNQLLGGAQVQQASCVESVIPF